MKIKKFIKYYLKPFIERFDWDMRLSFNYIKNQNDITMLHFLERRIKELSDIKKAYLKEFQGGDET